MLPDAETLLSLWYAFPWLVMLIITLMGILGYELGRIATLRYVWRVGIPHSIKENIRYYNNWKLRQKNAGIEY